MEGSLGNARGVINGRKDRWWDAGCRWRLGWRRRRVSKSLDI